MKLVLASTDWKFIFGIAIGAFAALVVAALFYWLQTRRDSLRLGHRAMTTPIIGSPPTDFREIEIRYRGTPIPRLTQVRLAVWNAGFKPITRDDVLKQDPLRVTVGNGEIVEASLIQQTRTAVGFTIDASSGKCDFALLDRGDGAIVELLHTGEPRSEGFSGTVTGMPQGPTSYVAAQNRGSNDFSIHSLLSLVIIGTFVATPVLLVAGLTSKPATNWATVAAGIGTGLACLVTILITAQYRARCEPPKALPFPERSPWIATSRDALSIPVRLPI
jgi:hypothetical protein